MKLLAKLYQHKLFILFTVFYFLFTAATYKIFPITADEWFRYQRGQEQLANFINSKPNQYNIFPSKESNSYYFYGALISILNPKFYYEWYHLQNMIISFIAFIAIYLLVFEYTKNYKFSVLGPILLFLTPNFSGMIAAAPIDMPFACFFLLAIYFTYKYRLEPFSFKKIIILGILYWPASAIRPIGFQIFLIFLVVNLFLTGKKLSLYSFLATCKTLIVVFIIANFFIVITWPYIGLNYFKNLLFILGVNAKYDDWNNLILFNGRLVSFDQRSKTYLLTYIFYTLPVFVLLPSLFGLLSIKFKELNLKFLIIFTIILNVILDLVIHPVIYNGMRHFLFLVPLFVSLSLFGLWDFYNLKLRKNYKLIAYSVLISSLVWTTSELIKLFPVHYAYFNEISGGTSKNIDKYETDYWGASYQKAAYYVRDSFKEKIKVYSCNLGFGVDYYMNKKHQVLIDSEDSNIIICDVVMDKQRGYTGQIIQTIKLGDADFIYIRKNK